MSEQFVSHSSVFFINITTMLKQSLVFDLHLNKYYGIQSQKPLITHRE